MCCKNRKIEQENIQKKPKSTSGRIGKKCQKILNYNPSCERTRQPICLKTCIHISHAYTYDTGQFRDKWMCSSFVIIHLCAVKIAKLNRKIFRKSRSQLPAGLVRNVKNHDCCLNNHTCKYNYKHIQL